MNDNEVNYITYAFHKENDKDVYKRQEYDILGRRSRIVNDDGLEVRYGYDALNRISRIHYGTVSYTHLGRSVV